VTPEQEEQVRRALASLAASEPVEPMPAEVARRLDGVLADLAADRTAGPATERPSAPTPARTTGPTGDERRDELEERRSRRWPKVLVAAAAVAVVAGGTATVLDRGSGGDDKASSSQEAGAATAPTTTATATGTTRARLQPGASGPTPKGQSFAGDTGGGAAGASSAGSAPSARAGQVRSVAPATRPRPPLRSTDLLHDVQSLVDRGTVDDLSVSGAAAAAALAPCRVPATTQGDHLLAVRLDGRRATLLLTAPAAGRRLARVYGCGDARHAEATTTVHDRLTSR
jgi:hypothetical protein